MAVFTEVTFDEVQAFVAPFGLGALKKLQGITAGIENTNYFVSTEQNEFVLTLFERLTFEQLPFYLELMRHLAQQGIRVPAPQPHQTGEQKGAILFNLKNKPAALVEKLMGKSQLHPLPHHCAQLGFELARMHLAGRDFKIQQPNLRGLPWWEKTVPLVLPFITPPQQALLQSELKHQQNIAASSAYKALPKGPIHADLFRDNVMFNGSTPENEKISGFFDFYFAGVDTFLFDVAVCLNDWCIDLKTGVLDDMRTSTLLEAYQLKRPLLDAELELLPDMLRAGALRFWTSRLWDYHLPRTAQMLVPHDPTHFERILKERVDHPYTL